MRSSSNAWGIEQALSAAVVCRTVTGMTYFPVVEIVKEAAGLADFDSPDVIESKVCAVLEGDEMQESVCARVSQLLGVQETASPDETHWAIRRFLEALPTSVRS